MNHQKYDLGQLNGGESVEVILKGNAANVMLMDNINYSKYKRGQKYSYYGGYVKRSPFIITVPSSNQWFIIIDLGGDPGSISSSVRIL